MKATCIHNFGGDLARPEQGFFYTPNTIFELSIGSSYVVFAMGIFGTALLILVRDETGKPNWLPINLFLFEEQSLPVNWIFVLIDPTRAVGGSAVSDWAAIWGYAELVSEMRVVNQLIERDPTALERFNRLFNSVSNE